MPWAPSSDRQEVVEELYDLYHYHRCAGQADGVAAVFSIVKHPDYYAQGGSRGFS